MRRLLLLAACLCAASAHAQTYRTIDIPVEIRPYYSGNGARFTCTTILEGFFPDVLERGTSIGYGVQGPGYNLYGAGSYTTPPAGYVGFRSYPVGGGGGPAAAAVPGCAHARAFMAAAAAGPWVVQVRVPEGVYAYWKADDDRGLSVPFDGTASFAVASAGRVPVSSYQWAFSDGGTSTASAPTHRFAEPGTYTVTLRVTDAAGNIDTHTGQVTVEGPDLSYTVSSAPDSVHVGDDFQLFVDITNTGDVDLTDVRIGGIASITSLDVGMAEATGPATATGPFTLGPNGIVRVAYPMRATAAGRVELLAPHLTGAHGGTTITGRPACADGICAETVRVIGREMTVEVEYSNITGPVTSAPSGRSRFLNDVGEYITAQRTIRPGASAADAVGRPVPLVPGTRRGAWTLAATSESAEVVPSCGAGTNSVWFSFTAPADGRFAADTFGSRFDTVLSVWERSGHPLTEVACNDDTTDDLGHGVVQSRTEFAAVAGPTYRVRVAGRAGAPVPDGLAVACVRSVERPVHDDVADALPLGVGPEPYVWSGEVDAASPEEGGEPACGAASENGWATNSLWWRYTPAVSGPLTVATLPVSETVAEISLWTLGDGPPTGIGGRPLEVVACATGTPGPDDDGDGAPDSGDDGTQVVLLQPVTAGQTYVLRATGTPGPYRSYPYTAFQADGPPAIPARVEVAGRPGWRMLSTPGPGFTVADMAAINLVPGVPGYYPAAATTSTRASTGRPTPCLRAGPTCSRPATGCSGISTTAGSAPAGRARAPASRWCSRSRPRRRRTM